MNKECIDINLKQERKRVRSIIREIRRKAKIMYPMKTKNKMTFFSFKWKLIDIFKIGKK